MSASSLSTTPTPPTSAPTTPRNADSKTQGRWAQQAVLDARRRRAAEAEGLEVAKEELSALVASLDNRREILKRGPTFLLSLPLLLGPVVSTIVSKHVLAILTRLGYVWYIDTKTHQPRAFHLLTSGPILGGCFVGPLVLNDTQTTYDHSVFTILPDGSAALHVVKYHPNATASSTLLDTHSAPSAEAEHLFGNEETPKQIVSCAHSASNATVIVASRQKVWAFETDTLQKSWEFDGLPDLLRRTTFGRRGSELFVNNNDGKLGVANDQFSFVNITSMGYMDSPSLLFVGTDKGHIVRIDMPVNRKSGGAPLLDVGEFSTRKSAIGSLLVQFTRVDVVPQNDSAKAHFAARRPSVVRLQAPPPNAECTWRLTADQCGVADVYVTNMGPDVRIVSALTDGTARVIRLFASGIDQLGQDTGVVLMDPENKGLTMGLTPLSAVCVSDNADEVVTIDAKGKLTRWNVTSEECSGISYSDGMVAPMSLTLMDKTTLMLSSEHCISFWKTKADEELPPSLESVPSVSS